MTMLREGRHAMYQDEYILQSLFRLLKKKWEHHAINRIYHRLNDPTIEFVCQQCVRKDDKYYLVDLFLPQFNLYLEIDEPHHNSPDAMEWDEKRRDDIVNASGLEEHRIAVNGGSLAEFEAKVDDFIELVRNRKKEALARGEFREWDRDGQLTAAPHLKAGFMKVGRDAVFRTHKDALNCFGYTKGQYQRAAWDVPEKICGAIGFKGSCRVWFPNLYSPTKWENELSDDGLTIIEKSKTEEVGTVQQDFHIVMRLSSDALNRNLYRFTGVFEVTPETRTGFRHEFRRIADRVKTYRAE